MVIDGIKVKCCPICKLEDEISVSRKELPTPLLYRWNIVCKRCDLSMGVVMQDGYNEDVLHRDENENMIFKNGRKSLIEHWNKRYGEYN